MAVMVSKVKGTPLDWPDMGTEKPALDKVKLDEESPENETSLWSRSIEDPIKELSIDCVVSDLGFLAACVA